LHIKNTRTEIPTAAAAMISTTGSTILFTTEIEVGSESVVWRSLELPVVVMIDDSDSVVITTEVKEVDCCLIATKKIARA
jgi:hypothetical protein